MKYLFIIIFLPLFGFAQEQIEISVAPRPYNPKPYYGQLNITNIKKVIIISKQKQDNFKDDTLYVYEYNEMGQQIKSLRYEHNKITNQTVMKYDRNNNQIQWTILEPNGTQTTTNFYYNQFNQPDSTKQFSYRQEKIMQTSRYAYQYEKGKLKFRQIIFNDILNNDDSYRYSDNLLMEYKSIRSSTVYFISNYTYDTNHQLAEIKTTHFLNGKSEVWNKKNFIYQNERLISEEELTYDNKRISTSYYYSSNNKLKKISSSFRENNQEIEFQYNGINMEEITVNANSNSAYLKFYIPLSLEIITFPITYKERFFYDKKNNLVSKKNLIGSELVQESIYVIEYYK